MDKTELKIRGAGLVKPRNDTGEVIPTIWVEPPSNQRVAGHFGVGGSDFQLSYSFSILPDVPAIRLLLVLGEPTNHT